VEVSDNEPPATRKPPGRTIRLRAIIGDDRKPANSRNAHSGFWYDESPLQN
jgi:hypothetical protein